jgi:adenosine deaminase
VEEFSRFRQWLDQQEANRIQVELLIGIGRNRTVEEFETVAPLILKLYEAGLIVGVTLAGPERGWPVLPFKSFFAEFHEAGLGIEIHAGEWCGPESVWDALENGYPDRIGHGVALFDDPRLIDLIRERAIHLEMCPTCNLKTGSVAALDQHPIRRARDLGMNFSLNTDDPGVVGCSMQSEYDLVSRLFGFSEAAFQQIYANTLRARFQPELDGTIVQGGALV